ncbi:MAG: hypothetical protein WCS21_07740 [Lachnospiraceae bacterium]
MEKYIQDAKRAIDMEADFALESCKFQSREHNIQLYWIIDEFQKAFAKKVKSISADDMSSVPEEKNYEQ